MKNAALSLLAIFFSSCATTLHSGPAFISEILDGETLLIRIEGQNQPVTLCGITSKIGTKAELKKLLKANDAIIVVGSGNHVEIFVPTETGEEIHLNSELLLRGMADLDEGEVDSCPNGDVMRSINQ